MSFDIETALRRFKPHKQRGPLIPLIPRTESKLAWIDGSAAVGGPVLLDTTVYIDVLQRSTPAKLDELIVHRIANHSAVCISELTHAFGRLNPADPRTPKSLNAISAAIRNVPRHRIYAPDVEVWALAGILGGLLFRLGSFPAGAERKCLNDALIYLQARKLGCPIVTSNRKDFDYLNQLVPDGRVLFYRKSA